MVAPALESIYEYKGKKYKLICSGLMNIGGVWVDSVNYQAMYDIVELPKDVIFTRTKRDFESKFKLCEKINLI